MDVFLNYHKPLMKDSSTQIDAIPPRRIHQVSSVDRNIVQAAQNRYSHKVLLESAFTPSILFSSEYRMRRVSFGLLPKLPGFKNKTII